MGYLCTVKCIAVIGVIKADCSIVRKRLGRTSKDREDSGKKGRVTIQTERKQEVQDEREIMPCGRM